MYTVATAYVHCGHHIYTLATACTLWPPHVHWKSHVRCTNQVIAVHVTLLSSTSDVTLSFILNVGRLSLILHVRRLFSILYLGRLSLFYPLRRTSPNKNEHLSMRNDYTTRLGHHALLHSCVHHRSEQPCAPALMHTQCAWATMRSCTAPMILAIRNDCAWTRSTRARHDS